MLINDAGLSGLCNSVRIFEKWWCLRDSDFCFKVFFIVRESSSPVILCGRKQMAFTGKSDWQILNNIYIRHRHLSPIQSTVCPNAWILISQIMTISMRSWTFWCELPAVTWTLSINIYQTASALHTVMRDISLVTLPVSWVTAEQILSAQSMTWSARRREVEGLHSPALETEELYCFHRFASSWHRKQCIISVLPRREELYWLEATNIKCWGNRNWRWLYFVRSQSRIHSIRFFHRLHNRYSLLLAIKWFTVSWV